MAEMAELGVTFFTDDGTGVQDDRLMRRALEYAAGLDVTLAQHCEVSSLSEGTCMHEGEWSARLGLPGQPSEAEELMVMRDIALSRLTGGRMHFQHMSTAGSVAMMRPHSRLFGHETLSSTAAIPSASDSRAATSANSSGRCPQQLATTGVPNARRRGSFSLTNACTPMF